MGGAINLFNVKSIQFNVVYSKPIHLTHCIEIIILPEKFNKPFSVKFQGRY